VDRKKLEMIGDGIKGSLLKVQDPSGPSGRGSFAELQFTAKHFDNLTIHLSIDLK
jgi:hypothetical protein